MDRLALEDSKVILDFTIGVPNCYSLSSFEHSSSQLFGKATLIRNAPLIIIRPLLLLHPLLHTQMAQSFHSAYTTD